MAARSKTESADDVIDAVEVDELGDHEEFEVDPFDDDDALDPEEDVDLELEDPDNLEEAEDDQDRVSEDEDLEVAEAAEAGDSDDEEDTLDVAVIPPEAAFDEGEDEIVAAIAVEEEPDEIRDGEFVCRGCHLAKRDTQLADEKAMLCRDCA